MIETKEQLAEALKGSALDGREIVTMPILDSGEEAFVLELAPSEIETAWHGARNLLDQTGRWPVVGTSWSGGGDFKKRLLDEELFSRFYFEEAPGAADVSPRSLIELSRTLDGADLLLGVAKARAEEEDFEEFLPYDVEVTEGAYGKAPTIEEASAGSDGTLAGLDRWLMEWESTHGLAPNPEENRFPWFTPDHPYLLFLPTASSWETLAYVNWQATSIYGTQHYIALGKAWEARFGAELVCNYGTMLQCLVSNPPTELSDAYDLAQEHDFVAPSTLAPAGISVRHYAHGLVNHDRWFLHERP